MICVADVFGCDVLEWSQRYEKNRIVEDKKQSESAAIRLWPFAIKPRLIGPIQMQLKTRQSDIIVTYQSS